MMWRSMRKINKVKGGENLQQIRKSHGYTQEKLAEEIGCSSRYISDIEKNRSNPSYEVLVGICNVFKIGMNDIYADYLDILENGKLNYGLSGFENLNEEDKKTIEHLIAFFNAEKDTK